MGDNIRIVGICLIKNEDLYIERVLKNILDFCDDVIVLDNISTDNTFKIVKKLTKVYKKIKLLKVKNLRNSHKFIEKYANTLTWIFGVDGDEIYDPIGLNKLKSEILSGRYQKYWNIYGNCLNCKELDLVSQTGKGYLAPPSRSITKLYNFSIIKSWKVYNQRLHGSIPIFKKGDDRSLRYILYESYDWDRSHFRCLHLCFMKRSSLSDNKCRYNIAENIRLNKENINEDNFKSHWKLLKYSIGKLETKNIKIFLNKN